MAEKCSPSLEESSPQPIYSEIVEQRQGGYECELVSIPPEAVQTKCVVCLLLPREPCLMSCPCGEKICRDCAAQLKRGCKPCPRCNTLQFTFIRDHGLERLLMGLEVLCSQKKNGCAWRGKLEEFESHLKPRATTSNINTGCQCLEVECVNGCGEVLQRRHIQTHEQSHCRERKYTCEFCQYSSTYRDIIANHYYVCKKYPLTCPSCGERLERGKISRHNEKRCPFTEINCQFHYAGCDVRLPRKHMSQHMQQHMSSHLSMLASLTQQLLKQNQQLQMKCKSLEDENHLAENRVKEVQIEVQELWRAIGGFPIDFRVNFSATGEIFLPAFYSHAHGYRMRLKVYPIGVGERQGTHVSIFVCLVRGPHDDHLNWPFMGAVTIQIVNQAGDHSHFEDSIIFNKKTPKEYQAERVTRGEISGKGWGKQNYISHQQLRYNSVRNTQYMKDNFIIVRVIKVKYY